MHMYCICWVDTEVSRWEGVQGRVSIIRRFDSPKIQLKLKLALTLTLTLNDTEDVVLTLTDRGGAVLTLTNTGGTVQTLTDTGGAVLNLTNTGGTVQTLTNTGGAVLTLTNTGGAVLTLTNTGGTVQTLTDTGDLQTIEPSDYRADTGFTRHAVLWWIAMLLNSSTSESSVCSGSSSSWKSLSRVDSWWKPTPFLLWDNKLPRLRRRLCRLVPKHGSLPAIVTPSVPRQAHHHCCQHRQYHNKNRTGTST